MKTCDNCKYQSTCFCINCYVTVDDGPLYWAPKNQLNIEHSEYILKKQAIFRFNK